MSYGLSHLKIDLHGEKGNVYYVISAAKNLVRQVEGDEAASEFSKRCHGRVQIALGMEWTYENVLQEVIDKTGITFVSPVELPIDPDLYTIEPSMNCYL